MSQVDMNISNLEVQNFIRNHGRRFPYSDVRKTRRSFHVKWLLLRAPHRFVTLPSLSLKKSTVNYLVVTKQAWPVTPLMETIIEHMEFIGREEDPVWHRQVVDWLAFICREGIKRDAIGILYDCVAFRARRIVYRNTLSTTSGLTASLLDGRREQFFHHYHNVSTDFASLKDASLAHLEHEIESTIFVVPAVAVSDQ